MRARRRADSCLTLSTTSESVGDSDAIFSHLVGKYRLAIDDNLTASQRSMTI